MTTFALYLVVGALAGTLAGLFGVGGGLIIVPILALTFQWQGVDESVRTQLALGTSLATIVFTSLSSVRAHQRRRAVRWDAFVYLAAGLAVGSVAGGWIASAMPGSQLEGLIGLFAIAMAIRMAIETRGQAAADARPPDEHPLTLRQPPSEATLLAVGGVVIGIASVMFGIGGGSLVVPFLTWRGLRAQQAVGTAAACGFPIAVFGASTYAYTGFREADLPLPPYSTGYIYWPAFIGIVVTSVIFATQGARLAHYLQPRTLRRAFAVLLFVIGLQFLFKWYMADPTIEETVVPVEAESSP